MKCEDKIEEYCRQAISYRKYAKYRRCNKCCIECLEPCGNICPIAIEINEKKHTNRGYKSDNRHK